MKFVDKVKIAFKNDGDFFQWLQRYATDFLSGSDSTINTSSVAVDPETAMRYSAVFACVRVLSETLATLPFKLYRKNGTDRIEANDLPIYDILAHAPNPEMTPFNFKEAIMTSLCLGGTSYNQKLYNARGDLLGLYPINWQTVDLKRDSNKQLSYVITDGIKQTQYTRKDIFHIPGLSLDGINGLSPIGYAAEAIRLGMIYETFGSKFFKNGAIPSGVIKSPEVMKEEAFLRFKKDFKKNYAGMLNLGTPMILEAGMEYVPLNISQQDAQFLDSRKFQIEDICRIYRVPLHLVQDLSRSTNNNIEQQSLEFIMYTMLPWCDRIEENIMLQLLTPEERKAGYFVEAKLDAIMRGDSASRANAYAAGRQWGWLSVNDIRRMENMNAIPNGDIYIQPLNFIEAGKEPPAQTASKAMAEKYYEILMKGGEISE